MSDLKWYQAGDLYTTHSEARMETRFIEGGEYVDRKTYIMVRDENSQLRERIAELENQRDIWCEDCKKAWAQRDGAIARYEAAEERIAELEDILRDVWEQFAYTMPDGKKSDGGLSTLESVKHMLQSSE